MTAAYNGLIGLDGHCSMKIMPLPKFKYLPQTYFFLKFKWL